MKKYRCPKCGEFFEGELPTCPHCGTAMKYRNTINVEETIRQENANSVGSRFNFHADGVVYHPEDDEDNERYENDYEQESEDEEQEGGIPKAPEHYEEMILEEGESFFDGKSIERFGLNLLQILLSLGTALIAFPWAMCIKYRWETKHTVINGRRLCFDGTGSQLFGRYLLGFVLTICTLGIYGITLSGSIQAWKLKHTHFLTSSGEKI